MKEVKAIIDPGLLWHVMSALHALPHFPGVTVSDAQGQGARARRRRDATSPTGNALAFSKKIKLEILCSDLQSDQIVATIRKAAHVGQLGHGIVMVNDQ